MTEFKHDHDFKREELEDLKETPFYDPPRYREEHPDGLCTELEKTLGMKCSLNRTKLRKLKAVIESHRNASKSQDVKTTCNYILWNIEEIFKG